MTTAVLSSWLKKVDSVLLELNERPQFGLPQPFPLESLQSALASAFNKPKLELTVQQKGWVEPSELWQGLGENLRPLTIYLSPLEHPVFFVMSEQDLNSLTADLLTVEPAGAPFYDSALVEGFYQYFTLVVMQNIEVLGFGKPLSPRLAESPQDLKQQLESTSCFTLDIACDTGSRRVWGRLLISRAFRQVWKQQFKNMPLSILDPTVSQLPLNVSIQIAESEILLDEWQRIESGDVIILDRCSYDLKAKQGTAMIMLEQQALFRGKFKEGGLQLLEFPREELGVNMELDQEKSEEHTEQSELNIGRVPVTLTVEVARLKMTVEEISNLSVGSILQLPVAVEDGITLLINGQKMGRGELISVGEALGVRIISI